MSVSEELKVLKVTCITNNIRHNNYCFRRTKSIERRYCIRPFLWHRDVFVSEELKVLKAYGKVLYGAKAHIVVSEELKVLKE